MTNTTRVSLTKHHVDWYQADNSLQLYTQENFVTKVLKLKSQTKHILIKELINSTIQ